MITVRSRGAISDERFRKNEHILKSKDFRAAYKKGTFFKKESAVLYRLRNDLGHNRIGFSISSRNVRLASSRNRLKRLFREVYRRTRKDLKTAFDLVFVIRTDPGKNFSYKKAEEIFMSLVKKGAILS